MTDRGEGLCERLVRGLLAPRDAAGLAVFRVLFGLLGTVSAARFLAYGWVDELFVRPKMHFTYFGFEWVRPLPGPAMHALFVGLAVVSFAVALGLFYRAAIVLFFVGFTYVQLVDVTSYLNHYYLVSLLSGLMALLPMNAAWSVDARLFPGSRRREVPAWTVYLLRFQVAVVYTFAGLAKVNADWLVHGQPLNLWLSARTGIPVIGALFALPGAALVMSWAGCLFDLTIALWLSIPRTRPFAYAAVLVFHTLTGLLFPIGMFPFIMCAAAVIFFPPRAGREIAERAREQVRRLGRAQRTRSRSRRTHVFVWQRARQSTSWRNLIGHALRLSARLASHASRDVSPRQEPASTMPVERVARGWLAAGLGAFVVYTLLQVGLPLRGHLYRGNVLWHEQGMRWSWRVMLREKNASVTYHVEDPRSGKVIEVSPRRYLTPRQERDFGTQPDLVLQLGRHIAAEHAARAGGPVKVTVDAIASLNGRRAARLVDPNVDLSRIEDGFAEATWVLPMPEDAPIQLTPVAMR